MRCSWTVELQVDYGDPALDGIDKDPRKVDAGDRPPSGVVGGAMEAIGRALARIARDDPELLVVFPIHKNPVVREAIGLRSRGWTTSRRGAACLRGFARLMNRAHIVLTDSGGDPRGGPSLGKPVLVMRDTTERPEAIMPEP